MQQKRQTEVYFVRFHKKAGKAVMLLYDVLDSFKGAVVVVFIIFLIGVRAVGVSGDSMSSTLSDNDWVAVTSVTNTINRGDIVVVTKPWVKNIPVIKRVIAKGGDTIVIEDGKVYLNNELLDEDYIKEPMNAGDIRNNVSMTVPEGKLFVMGDNRNNSLDSRSSELGVIDEEDVLGKAVFRIFPNPKGLTLKED